MHNGCLCFTVLYCTLLAQAQSATERSQIESEMIADPELTEYLKQLQGDDEDGMDNSTSASRLTAKDATESMDTSESTRVSYVSIISHNNPTHLGPL